MCEQIYLGNALGVCSIFSATVICVVICLRNNKSS